MPGVSEGGRLQVRGDGPVTPGNCDQCGSWGARRASGLRPFPALCSRCLIEFEGGARSTYEVQAAGVITKLRVQEVGGPAGRGLVVDCNLPVKKGDRIILKQLDFPSGIQHSGGI